jgi:hypothetical protein
VEDATRKRPPEELEERYLKAAEEARESPGDPDAQVKAGQAAEACGRRLEAFAAYFRAADLDPTQSFLIPKLRILAPSPQEKDQIEKLAKRPTSFKAAFASAFSYPLRGRGLAMILIGAAAVWILRIISQYSLYSAAPAALAAAFLSMFYVDILAASSTGDPDLPDWPDPTRFQTCASEIARLWVPVLVSFLPIVAGAVFVVAGFLEAPFEDSVVPEPPRVEQPDEDDPAPLPLPTPLPAPERPANTGLLIAGAVGWALIGILYLPAGILCNVVFGNAFACLNVPFVIASLKGVRRDYALCVAAFYGVALLSGAIETALSVTGLFRLGGLAPSFLQIYGSAVLMRLLGLFYATHRARLNWMRKGD